MSNCLILPSQSMRQEHRAQTPLQAHSAAAWFLASAETQVLQPEVCGLKWRRGVEGVEKSLADCSRKAPSTTTLPVSMCSCLGSSMNKGNSVRLSWWLCLGPWKGKKNEETILTTRSYPRVCAVLPDRTVIRRQLGQVPGFPKNICGRILCGLWFSKLDKKKKKSPTIK